MSRIAGGGGTEVAAPRRSPAVTAADRGLDPHAVAADQARSLDSTNRPLERFWLMLKRLRRCSTSAAACFAAARSSQLVRTEVASQHLDRVVVDAADLPHLDPRLASPRPCATAAASMWRPAGPFWSAYAIPELPVRNPARGAVRRRQLRAVVSAARPDLRAGVAALVALRANDWSIICGTSRCRPWPWWWAASPRLTLLTKNSFLEEIRKQYVVTARAKGASERRVLYGHVFRNSMLLVIAEVPGGTAWASCSARLVADRDHLLAGWPWAAWLPGVALQRDYPLIFGTLYMFTLFGLVLTGGQRHHLYPRGSAHRLLHPRRMTLVAADPPPARGVPRASPWLVVAVDLHRPVRGHRAVRGTRGQRPAAGGPL